MSTMLHPEGPEEPRTYWMRRGISVGVVVLLVLVVALIWPRGGEPQTASPQPTAGHNGPAAATVSPPVSNPASTTATATPSSSPAQSTPTPTESESAKSRPVKSKPPKSKPTKSKPTKTAKAASGTAACSPEDLKVGLSGPGSARAAKPVKFDVSVASTAAEECQLKVDTKNFELRVYSGSDRIFSTKDCPKWAPFKSKTLKPGKKFEFKTSWGATRTAKKCKTTKQLLQAGTYVATAELDRAKPAQHVMRLK